MFAKLSRTFKSGWKNLVRNGSLAVATIGVITITLFIINVQAATVFANNTLLEEVEDRVNISVYVNTEISESEILKIKNEIERYPEVKSVQYISREDALASFKELNSENETIKKAIEELGENPLGAALNIRAHDPNQYQMISKRIENSSFKESVMEVNYQKYSGVIENLNKEIKSNQRIALTLGITFSIIAVLITFNSIRITMYAHQKEIEIMRLVGASNNYIRLPFLWEGIFYGLIAVVIAVPLSYFYLRIMATGDGGGSVLPFSNSRFIQSFLSGYFVQNAVWIIFSQLFIGIFLGVISSILAIRKYLKI